MANIGATTAFYKVETSLTRANNEVSKSMERLATGKANANAGDRSSYVAMADTFRLDFVGTKAGIKGASVVMGYLETGMRVLDSASGLLARLQELAVLGANDTNTEADSEAIDREAEAIADEFHRLMSTSTYKGKNIFVDTAGGEYVSMGGRDSEMTFGIQKVEYSNLYLHSYLEYAAETAGVTVAATDEETAFNAKEAIADLLFDDNTSKAVLIENVAYENMDVFESGDATADALELDDLGNFTLYTTAATDGTNARNFTEAPDDTGAEGAQFVAQASGQLTNTTSLKFAKQEGQLLYAASEG